MNAGNENLPAVPEEKPEYLKAIDAALARMEVRKEFVSRAKGKLTKGSDWGEIPGIDKPALFKSGAQALVQSVTSEAEPLFLGCGRFGVPTLETKVEIHMSEEFPTGFYYYRFMVPVVGPGGAVLAWGVGSCSTKERKYAFKRDGTQREAWESANTVLKIAVKRAEVDAALRLSGGSSMFTQDVEDGAGSEGGDALDQPLKFGKYAGKSMRAVVGLDRGWVDWMAREGKNPGMRTMARAALDEADEMEQAQAQSQPEPEPDQAPAPVREPPPPLRPQVPAFKLDVERLRGLVIRAADDLKLQNKTPERKAFYDGFQTFMGAKLANPHWALDNLGQAEAALFPEWVAVYTEKYKAQHPAAPAPEPPPDMGDEAERDRLFQRQLSILAELYPTAAIQIVEHDKIALQVNPPHGFTKPIQQWPIAPIREVTKILEARLRSRDYARRKAAEKKQAEAQQQPPPVVEGEVLPPRLEEAPF